MLKFNKSLMVCINSQIYIDSNFGSYDDIKKSLNNVIIYNMTSEYQYFRHLYRGQKHITEEFIRFLFKVIAEQQTVSISNYDIMSPTSIDDALEWIFDEIQYLHTMNMIDYKKLEPYLSDWAVTGIKFFIQDMKKFKTVDTNDDVHHIPLEWLEGVSLDNEIKLLEYTIGVI